MTLPKFIALEPKPESDAEKICENIFAFHTKKPRFLMEFVPGGEGEFMLIDPTNDPHTDARHESKLRTLRDQARDFIYGESD